ncbi:MAG: hypothetical protein A2Y07_08140 [Planctomycetes bacterium GWF2_50_10]|nr:MAG: hypothetical protein A2Y07_08140 [Planctomycetes bacterium GWF2_50_10]
MYKASKLLTALFVVALAGNAFALNPNAFMGTIDSDWATGGNWTSGVTPTTEDVSIRAAAVIAQSTAAFANILRVGNGAYGPTEVGSIVIDGSLTIRYDVRIAEGTGVNGTITVNAGAILDNRTSAAVGEFAVGYGGTGTLNVYGTVYTKSMDITNWGWPSTSTGTVNVFAGGVVVDAGRLTVGGSESWGGNGSLVIYPGGSFSCGDNWSGKLQSWIDDSSIRAATGYTLTVTNHTTDAGKTFTVATPNATVPNPGNGATSVSMTPTLSWVSNPNVTQHQVFFGTSYAAVNAATVPNATISSTDPTQFVPGTLGCENTYFWRVDEFVSGDAGSPYKGTVWSFTTSNCVRDFNSDGIVNMDDFAMLARHWLLNE